MKKVMSAIMIAVMGALLFAGCGKTQEEAVSETKIELSFSEVEDLAETEEEPEEEEPVHEGEARNDLTGEWINEELAAQRPLAVMIGNTESATPQYGICSADVIYEGRWRGV